MGRLARCPECGGVTHPLAEHLLAPPTQSVALLPKPQPASPNCANCAQPLGKLETPRKWNGHVVCGPCHRTLADESVGLTQVTTLPIRGSERLQLRDDGGRTSRPGVVLLDARDAAPARLPASIAIDLRTLVGFFIATVLAAAAIYLVITIIHSIGVLISWAVAGIFALLIAYGFRRVLRAVRRKVGSLRPAGALPAHAAMRG
jgi:hypothetical protein